MMSLISAARISMALWSLPLLGHRVAELAELGAQAAVVDRVADLCDDAAEQRRILALHHHHLLARELLERGGDLGELGRGQRLRRDDLGRNASRLLLEHAIDLARDRRDVRETLLVEEDVEEVLRDRLGAEPGGERV